MKTNKKTVPLLPTAFPASRLAVLVAGLFTVAPLAHGADTDTPEVFQGGEIVTTATRSAPGVERVGTVRVVTAAEIQRKGARTLDEAIALLPGLYVRTGSDGTPRIEMRGLVTRQVKLFINGVPFNSTSDGQFDPTLIPVGMIAKIKVTMGASSVLYGDGDVAGVIDIITKQGTGAPHLTGVGIEGGSGGHYYAHAGMAGATDQTNYFLSASTYGHNWLPSPAGFNAPLAGNGNRLYNSDQHRDNLYSNIGFQATQALSFNLTTTHTEGMNGTPQQGVGQGPYTPAPTFERMTDLHGNTVQLTANYAPAGHWSGKSWIYYNELSEQDNFYDNNTYSTTRLATSSLNHMTTRIPGAHAQVQYEGATAGTLAFAVDGRREYLGLQTLAKTPSTLDKGIGVHSAALEYSVTPLPRTHLTAGYSRYWQTRDNGHEENANGFLLGSAYDLNARTKVRASVSQHIRFPSVEQLYDQPNGGNPALQMETGRNLEAGIDHRLSARTNVGATVFRDDVHNFINKDPISKLYQNNAHYLFKGIELAAHTKPLAHLDLGASYTYLQADDLSPGAAFETLQYKPRDKASASVAYDFASGWHAYADAQYVGRQYYYAKKAPVSQGELNNYTVVNLKLSKKLPDVRASWYLGVNNLFDRGYQMSYGFYQAGRVIYTGLESAF